jgi:hypothetical protein
LAENTKEKSKKLYFSICKYKLNYSLFLLLHTEKVAFYAIFGFFGVAFSNFGLFFCSLLSPQGKGTPFPSASRCASARRAARS